MRTSPRKVPITFRCVEKCWNLTQLRHARRALLTMSCYHGGILNRTGMWYRLTNREDVR